LGWTNTSVSEKWLQMAEEEGLSQRKIATRLGISRNTVARYCKGEHMPREPKRRNSRSKVITEEVEAFIQSCLKEGKDPKVSKKGAPYSPPSIRTARRGKGIYRGRVHRAPVGEPDTR